MDEQQVLTLKQRMEQDLKDLWNKDRLFLIAFGLVILLVKFRNIIIDLLVASGKSEMNAATKQNAVLQNQENKDNQQADQLAQQAEQLPQSEKPVTDDWNTKK